MTIFMLEAFRQRLEEKVFDRVNNTAGRYCIEICILNGAHIGVTDMVEGDDVTISSVALWDIHLWEKNEEAIVDAIVRWIEGEREK